MDGGYHASRLAPDARRDVLWRALWRHHLSALVPAGACVLDMGCGHGGFINAVTGARRRIALDSWPDFPPFLAPGIEAVVGSVTNLDFAGDGAVDFAFASNLFEHLTRADLGSVLAQLQRTLSARGTLTLVQPNYRYAHREYWDDYTHLTAWSHVSLPDFLVASGYEILDVVPRYMPLTIKSRLPVHPWLVAAYLASPVKPFGGQMLVRARPRRGAAR